MAKSLPKVFVYAPNHNGFQVFFMMHAEDFRVVDEETQKRFGYIVYDGAPTYVHKTKTLATRHGLFRVASDWSLAAVDLQAKAFVMSFRKRDGQGRLVK